MNALDLIGRNFGRLTVLKYIGYYAKEGTKSKQHWYECVCNYDNNIVIVSRRNLISNHTQSCGCISKDIHITYKKPNVYDLDSQNYGIGYTSSNEAFYFDKEDYNKIKEYAWYIEPHGYVCAKPQSGTIKMHRLIINAKSGEEVDHISHDKKDNRKQNLRISTRKENGKNLSLSKRNTSGVTGIWYRKDTHKWAAEIRVNQKKINLGSFEKFEDAVKARKDAEEKYFGEWSYDNSMKKAKENGFIEEN